MSTQLNLFNWFFHMFMLVLFTKQINEHFGFLTNTVASGVKVLGALAIELGHHMCIVAVNVPTVSMY